MTLIGLDKPGLVEAISSRVADHQANWVESRMAHLAGQFAGILRVEVAEQRADALVHALQELEREGLALVIHSAADPAAPAAGPLVRLELVGQDQPGIVSKITKALAAQGANVEELSSECLAAPTTGQTLFHAQAQLRLASAATVEQLRQELEQIAADLMVDLTIAPDPEPGEPGSFTALR